MTGGIVRIGGATVDLGQGRVTRPDGTTTELRPKSAALLTTLAARPDEVITKDELLAAVWPGIVIEEDGLVQCVGEIRRAIGPAAREALRTHARRGYSVSLDPPDLPRVPGTSGAPDTPARPRRLSGWHAMALAALIAVGGLASLGRTVTEAPANSAAAGSAAMIEAPVLAVFPFESLQPGTRWDRLATGLTRDVIADLGTNGWLFVLADAATRFAGTPSVETARQLGADFVVTGSLQAADGVVHVSATLAETATGRQLWTRRFEGPLEDLLLFQRAAAEAIAGELSPGWTGPIAEYRKVTARTGRPNSLAAYDFMLLAGERMELYTAEALAEAERLLKRAVEIEPDFGEAWAKLSLVSYNRLDPEMSPAETEALLEQGRAAALEAWRVAPDHPMALAQAANVLRWDDPDEAERMIRRAAALAPNNADILAYLSFRAAHFPALAPDALGWSERAIALNPVRPNWYDWNRGTVLMVLGRPAEAAEAYARAPDHIEAVAGRLAALALAGEINPARAGMTDLLRDRPHFTSRWYADASGLHPEVEAIFTRGFALSGAPAS